MGAMDVVGGFALADGTRARALIGIDGPSRIVCSGDGRPVHQRGLATGLDPVGLSPADAARDGTTTSRREPHGTTSAAHLGSSVSRYCWSAARWSSLFHR